MDAMGLLVCVHMCVCVCACVCVFTLGVGCVCCFVGFCVFLRG